MVQIAIEIVVGCNVTFVESIKVPPKGPAAYPNTYRGVITKKSTLMTIFSSDRIFHIKVPGIDEEFRAPEWVILQFTFGGVWVRNPKFDLQRLDKLIIRLTSRP